MTYHSNSDRIRANKTLAELDGFEWGLTLPGAVVLEAHDKIELARYRAELEGKK